MDRLTTARVRAWRLPLLVALVQAARLAKLARLPDRAMGMYFPDDAWYYLILGRNFATSGRWTFDGVEPASGFQLLWGYLAAAIYRLDPGISLQGVFLVEGLIQLVCTVAAAWMAVRIAHRLFGDGPGPELGIAVIFLSGFGLVMDLSMMETALMLALCSAAMLLLCRTELAPQREGRWMAAAALLGVLGMLARVDFVVLAVTLLALQAILWWRGLASVGVLKVAVCLIAGALAGGALIALHTHWISGQWVQASVLEKRFWRQVLGIRAWPFSGLVRRFFDASYDGAERSERFYAVADALTWVALAALLAGLAVFWVRGIALAERAKRRGLIAGMAAVTGAYGLFFILGSPGTEDWYVGNFQTSLAVFAAGGFAGFYGRWRRATTVVAAVVCLWGVTHSFAPARIWQWPLYGTGLYLKQHPELKPVGSWNAGIISYFAGGGVVNLDGLVNDRILPYAKAGTLLEYVRLRQLRSVVDYPAMLSPQVGRQGGYSDGRFVACLEAQEGLGKDPARDPGSMITPYRVKDGCLAGPATPPPVLGQDPER